MFRKDKSYGEVVTPVIVKVGGSIFIIKKKMWHILNVHVCRQASVLVIISTEAKTTPKEAPLAEGEGEGI